MGQSRSKSRGMMKVALSALLAAGGALLSTTGCSSEVSEGSGGNERLGTVRQNLLLCPGPKGVNVACPADTDCVVYACSKVLNGGCVANPNPDGDTCYLDKELGACVAGQCCTGCLRVDKLTREVTCEKGTTDAACGVSGAQCDTCLGSLCSTSSCNLEKRACDDEPIPDGRPCADDSGLCLGNACCRGCLDAQGNCVAGTSVNSCGRTTPQAGFVKCEDCDQGNVCSNYACTNGVCAAPTPKPGTCNDATVCNGIETCGDNQCNPGTPLNCTDSDPCTNNSCNAGNGCTVTPNTGANCSDNDLCTVTDKCAAGECKGTGSPNCDDNNPCTIDSCDPEKGCVHADAPNNDPCDDGNECSTGDRCVGGECLASGGKMCDDGNSCTQNTCNPQSQVCAYPNEDNGTPCVHTNKCVQNSTCQAGTCNAGPAIVCDDANPCTKDSCDPTTGCVFEEDDTLSCSDGNACTTDDACDSGDCEGTPVACAALDECHVPGTCNPLSGKCDDPRADDGTECNEGGPGTCTDGKCVLLPIGGAGGAPSDGGAPAAEGGAPSAAGGQSDPGAGGNGAATSEAGSPGEPGGPGDEEVRPFVRQPGGCACSVPASSEAGRAGLGLLGLALAAAFVRRRRPVARG